MIGQEPLIGSFLQQGIAQRIAKADKPI